MIEELDCIAFTRALPEYGLDEGDVGTVVAVHKQGAGFTVEVVSLTGETVAIVTLPADAVRPVAEGEIAHARKLTHAAE